MNLNLREVLLLAVIGMLVFFTLDGCNAKRKVKQQSISIAEYKDSVSFYKSESGELIAINTAIMVSSEKTIADLKKELEDLKLKKPEVVIKYRTNVRIDSITIKLDIPCEKFSKDYYIDSTDYKVCINLSDTSLLLKEIVIPNSQTIAVGNVRQKWYKPTEYSVVVKNSNPYVESVGLKAYTIKPEKKIYEKNWVWLTIGVLGGGYLGYTLNK